MTEIMTTGYPPYFVRGYIVKQLEEFSILTGREQMNPIFPTTPTNIEDVFKNYLGSPGVEDPVLIQYERLIKQRSGPFYRKKMDQLVLYVYSTSLSKVIDTERVIVEALDREDAAAQDVNLWMAENVLKDDNNNIITNNVLFHNFRVFQINESREISTLKTAKTLYGTKVILEYSYHTKDSLYN